MNTYQLMYEYSYPDGKEYKTCYVLANSFDEAERKVLSRFKGEYEGVHVQSIRLLEADIIV